MPDTATPARRRRLPGLLAGLALLLWAATGAAQGPAAEPRCVRDDLEREICVQAAEPRIISLAPHITEQLFAVGAGALIVGTVNFSDYPPEAEAIPRVGGYNRIDVERVLAKAPDLVVAWRSGNPRAHVERLEALGLTVYVSEPRRFEDVARALERLGRLAGREQAGAEAADGFRDEVAALRRQYADRDRVSLYYQIWDQPLMTVNDEHLIGEAIALCGGWNVFGDSDRLTPKVDRESVLGADPEAILASGMGEEREDWVDEWRAWPASTAVQRDNLFFIPPSLLQRHTPRILEGTRLLCEALETARGRRPE
ncbi:cobalamin-binding protein [Alkalilimnicola ehrlichii MLHE-1]|uniref:Periplasmic binding protein n=1 Tax=Alkalilimnicola ehrlichii (strain ATCC BAA-1101 / DSM 17681 / MLHE-1) TaxID=187272 RepID=Q0A4S7_ALKEH|nr:cobalamin-binding protein [Alkalilimnicola ehrlichii]ABI58160.1 periplasmic binding protein [Alkalilimnicola ehrlichii MLHE-1]